MSEKKYVITIAREYGSGGRLIGQKLAEMLNISFYDKEIISLAAEESGLSEEFMRQHDQKKKPLSFVHNIYVSNKSLPLSEQIFQAQCQVIREVAEKSSCVIVGRCADHVLTDRFLFRPLKLKKSSVSVMITRKPANRLLPMPLKLIRNELRITIILRWKNGETAKTITLSLTVPLVLKLVPC